jgi:hypothetical protein
VKTVMTADVVTTDPLTHTVDGEHRTDPRKMTPELTDHRTGMMAGAMAGATIDTKNEDAMTMVMRTMRFIRKSRLKKPSNKQWSPQSAVFLVNSSKTTWPECKRIGREARGWNWQC